MVSASSESFCRWRKDVCLVHFICEWCLVLLENEQPPDALWLDVSLATTGSALHRYLSSLGPCASHNRLHFTRIYPWSLLWHIVCLCVYVKVVIEPSLSVPFMETKDKTKKGKNKGLRMKILMAGVLHKEISVQSIWETVKCRDKGKNKRMLHKDAFLRVCARS